MRKEMAHPRVREQPAMRAQERAPIEVSRMTATQALEWSQGVPHSGPKRKAYIDANYCPRKDGYWDHISSEAREVIDFLERELFAVDVDYNLRIALAIDRGDQHYAVTLGEGRRLAREPLVRQIVKIDSLFIRPLILAIVSDGTGGDPSPPPAEFALPG